MTAILAFFQGAWGKVAEYGLLVLAALAVYLKIRQSGKDAANNAQLEKALEEVKQRDKIETDIHNLDPRERDKLRDKYYRD